MIKFGSSKKIYNLNMCCVLRIYSPEFFIFLSYLSCVVIEIVVSINELLYIPQYFPINRYYFQFYLHNFLSNSLKHTNLSRFPGYTTVVVPLIAPKLVL